MTARVRAVYFDQNFRFFDGEAGVKLFVVLADCSSQYIAAKTTSRQRTRSSTLGCNLNDRWQNFFVPAAQFEVDTWIDLQGLYSFTKVSLDAAARSGYISLKLFLDKNTFSALLRCAIGAEGTTKAEAQCLQDTLAQSSA